MKKFLKRLLHVVLVLLFFPFIHIITAGFVTWMVVLIAPEHDQLAMTVGLVYVVGILFIWFAVFIWHGFDRMSQFEEDYKSYFLTNQK